MIKEIINIKEFLIKENIPNPKECIDHDKFYFEPGYIKKENGDIELLEISLCKK